MEERTEAKEKDVKIETDMNPSGNHAQDHPSRALTEVFIRERHRVDLGDIDSLARSIDEVGLLHPIVITPKGELIAGRRRLEAVRELGWSTVPVRVVDIDGVVSGEAAENFQRKDFLPSEAVAIVDSIDRLERFKAQERQLSSLKKGDGGPRAGNLPARDKGRARDKVAQLVGMSGRTYEKAKLVIEAAEANPEEYGPLLKEMDRTGKVDGAARKLKVSRQAALLEREALELPKGPFRVIVADPPWQFQKREGDPSHRGACPYPSMSNEEIAAMKITDLAYDDSVLWLWATNAHMEEAFGISRAWGFEQKSILTWVKDRMGIGDWLRGRTEHCLFCARGRPTVRLTNQTTVLDGKVREHSRKPEEFYAMVEDLCPGSKIEVFSREAREGWERYGDEAQGASRDATASS